MPVYYDQIESMKHLKKIGCIAFVDDKNLSILEWETYYYLSSYLDIKRSLPNQVVFVLSHSLKPFDLNKMPIIFVAR